MAFSYSATSPGARDKVRLLIGDTSSSSFVYDDAEIDVFLTLFNSDPQLAAAQALRTLAADRAKQAIYYNVQGFSMNRSSVPTLLLQAAEAIQKGALQVPWELESIVEDIQDSAGRDLSNYPDVEAQT